MLYNLCNAGRENWASEIRSILYRYGFGYVWENQQVECIDSFLNAFEQRVKDCDLQRWSDSLSNMPKLTTYSLLKSQLNPEPYLTLCIPFKIRSAIAKFRISNNNLEIETGRHENLEVNGRLCKLCASVNMLNVEDEYHVLMVCPFYQDLRNVYIENQLPCNIHSFISIMSTNDESRLIKLGCFINNMFILRNVLLSTL